MGAVLLAGLAAQAQAAGNYGICLSESALGPGGFSNALYATNSIATLAASCSPNGLTSSLVTQGATVTPSSLPANLTNASLNVTSPTATGGLSIATSGASLDLGALRLSADSSGPTQGCGGTCTSTAGRAIAYTAFLDTLTFSITNGAPSATVGIIANLDGGIGGNNFNSGAGYNIMEVFGVGGGQACFTTSGGATPFSDGPCGSGNGGFGGTLFSHVTTTGFSFAGTFTVTNGEISKIFGVLEADCADGANCDFASTASYSLVLPANVGFNSDSGVFTRLKHVPSKVGIWRPSTFNMVAQDVNGNIAWDPGIDHADFFGQTGDTVIFGDWDGSGTTKMGIFRPSVAMFALDVNGNGTWDPGVDKFGFFGQNGDVPIIGDWTGDGISKIGIYRPSTGLFALDVNNNLAYDSGTDRIGKYGLVGDTPLIGDWTGDKKSKVGVFRNGLWILDSNNDLTQNAGDGTGTIGQAGDTPLVGDWNGDGKTKVGIYRSSVGMFGLDYNGNLVWDAGTDRAGVFGPPGSGPVVGDWDGSGVTRAGIFYSNGYWALDINGNLAWDGGIDTWGGFGAAGDTPVVGKW